MLSSARNYATHDDGVRARAVIRRQDAGGRSETRCSGDSSTEMLAG